MYWYRLQIEWDYKISLHIHWSEDLRSYIMQFMTDVSAEGGSLPSPPIIILSNTYSHGNTQEIVHFCKGKKLRHLYTDLCLSHLRLFLLTTLEQWSSTWGTRKHLTSIKMKHSNCLNHEQTLILTLAKIHPQIEVLACQKQAQSSH
jgi:hypothetical protein